jgi:hypothetical protein
VRERKGEKREEKKNTRSLNIEIVRKERFCSVGRWRFLHLTLITQHL